VLVVVLVLVLDTQRLKSFEDEHEYEDEDETSTEFIGNCVDLAQFLFFDQTGCHLAGGRRSCETTLNDECRLTSDE